MNINDLEKVSKEWLEEASETTPAAILELIAAYREAVAAICNTLNGADTSRRDCRAALATAKRLGVE